jgi:hypothetical protein
MAEAFDQGVELDEVMGQVTAGIELGAPSVGGTLDGTADQRRSA